MRTRPLSAAIAKAERLVTDGRAADAAGLLMNVLQKAPPGFVCWTVPIEPAFQTVIALPAFAPFLQELAARAR
jgi:hypothetical protein